ncbi:MAG: bacillithiol system redox-active protein YtxJ [Gemmatimonadales bacterium]|jgi:bacillithiol system protein YtxJ|nr:bacillithiol system redox-active protein YtxJ [Gemmatimonadales bacterium]
MQRLTDDLASELLRAPRALIFKHSTRCGTSRRALAAFGEVEAALGETPAALLDVIADRALAQRVAEVTGVRHESPQLLLLERGRVRQHLSHGAITSDAVRRLLEAPDRG